MVHRSQVLKVFADAQWPGKGTARPPAASPVPCQLLEEAAGLHGHAKQEISCDKVQLSVRAALAVGQVDPYAVSIVEMAASAVNVAATASNLLMIPEYLYLPARILEYVRSASDPELDVDNLVLQMCFVNSHIVTLNYHHIWDLDAQHQSRVCSVQLSVIRRLKKPLCECTFLLMHIAPA